MPSDRGSDDERGPRRRQPTPPGAGHPGRPPAARSESAPPVGEQEETAYQFVDRKALGARRSTAAGDSAPPPGESTSPPRERPARSRPARRSEAPPSSGRTVRRSEATTKPSPRAQQAPNRRNQAPTDPKRKPATEMGTKSGTLIGVPRKESLGAVQEIGPDTLPRGSAGLSEATLQRRRARSERPKPPAPSEPGAPAPAAKPSQPAAATSSPPAATSSPPAAAATPSPALAPRIPSPPPAAKLHSPAPAARFPSPPPAARPSSPPPAVAPSTSSPPPAAAPSTSSAGAAAAPPAAIAAAEAPIDQELAERSSHAGGHTLVGHASPSWRPEATEETPPSVPEPPTLRAPARSETPARSSDPPKATNGNGSAKVAPFEVSAVEPKIVELPRAKSLAAAAAAPGYASLPKASRNVSVPPPALERRVLRVSKQRYQLTIFGGLGMSIVLGALSAFDSALLLVCWVPLLASASAMLSLLYWMWYAIQDGKARTTPQRAVALMFVPLFNLYWAFHVVAGYATDYNEFVARHMLKAPRLSRDLLLAAMVVPVANLVIGWKALERVCEAVNAVASQTAAGRRRSRPPADGAGEPGAPEQ